MIIENNVLKKVFYEDIENGTVIIPDNVTEIGSDAFEGRKNLISINIPNNVTYIGKYAFTNCEKLIKKGNFKACNITYNSDEIIYSCLNTKYEIGKKMTTINNIECGKRGYHYVKNLYDIFNCYYGNLNNIALFEIEAGDIIKKDVVDDLYVTNTIKLVRQIPWNEAFEN